MIADMASRARIEMTHEPYRGGGQMATSVIAGETDLCMLSLSSALPHLAAGKLRAVAIAAEAPLTEPPGVPTIASVVANAAARPFWHGCNVALGTPLSTIAALNAPFRDALTASETRVLLDPLGIQVVASSPEAYRAWMAAETTRRAEMARAAGIVPE